MIKANLKLIYTAFVTVAVPVFFLLSSCKKDKEKVYQIQGRLLISSSNPAPVPNYSIDFYQSGSPGVPFPAYTLSSSASAVTDVRGYFKCDFRLGKSSFLFLNGTNSRPVQMEGRANASYPYFSFSNIPLTDLGDIFLYKKIDTAIIEVSSPTGILSTDTVEFYYYTFNGFKQKIKSGVSVTAGTTKTIDTLYNVITSNYFYSEKKYGSPVTVRQTKNWNLLYQYMSPGNLIESGDEKKRVFLLQ